VGFIEIILLAVGLSMDSFAVSICTGLPLHKVTLRKALTVGVCFGVFHIAMPLIGYSVASILAERITTLDHWIAFGLLIFLGGKMALGSLKKDEDESDDSDDIDDMDRLTLAKLLPMALATSIDALAIGVSFAFLRVNVLPAVMMIGVITGSISMCGLKIGNTFGSRFRSKAELVGGVILILIGLKILLEHSGVLVALA